MIQRTADLNGSNPPGAKPLRARRSRSKYIGGAFLCLAILCAPFYYYRFAGGAFNITLFRLFLIPAFLAGLFRMLLIDRRRGGRRAGPAFQLALAAGIVYLLFSLVQVMRSQYAIALPTFLIQCEGYLLVATVMLWVDSWTRFGTLIKFFMASVAIPGAIAIYQQAGFWSLGVILPLPLVGQLSSFLVAQDNSLFGGIHLQPIGGMVFARSASTMVDANFFGSFVGCIALVCMGVAGSRHKSGRDFMIRAAPFVCALSVVLLFMTMSRTAWFGFVIGLGYLLYKTARFRGRWILWIAAFGLLCASGLALAAYFWNWDVMQLLKERAMDYTRGIGARVDLIQQGFDPFIESPFFGLGRCNLIAYSGFPTTHVFYLTRLFEDGLAGITMILTCLAALWWATRPGRNRHHPDGTVGMVQGVRAAFLCLLVANLGYDHLMSLEVNWVVIALVFGLAKLIHRGGAATVSSR
jgi:hypothetical protein